MANVASALSGLAAGIYFPFAVAMSARGENGVEEHHFCATELQSWQVQSPVRQDLDDAPAEAWSRNRDAKARHERA